MTITSCGLGMMCSSAVSKGPELRTWASNDFLMVVFKKQKKSSSELQIFQLTFNLGRLEQENLLITKDHFMFLCSALHAGISNSWVWFQDTSLTCMLVTVYLRSLVQFQSQNFDCSFCLRKNTCFRDCYQKQSIAGKCIYSVQNPVLFDPWGITRIYNFPLW